MEQTSNQLTLLKDIVDRISVGVFVVNKQNELVLWNGYMENYSQTKSEDVVGKNIFESFPDLPKNWLEQKIHNVFVIKNFSFTSWEHRPYLFKFLHNRPITGGIDYMRQNCTFLPMKGESGDIEFVCITLFDVTDTSIYESMLKNAVRSLAEASNRDGLTNVYNRRFLETSMAKEFSRIKRYGGTLTFIIVDLDHFKAVNDNHGHLAGDEILKVAAKRLAEGLRTADTLSRYGGEEFAVMLPETPVDGATILAQRLCDNLAATPVQFGDNSITVSASLGVAEFQPDMESYEVMIARADDMLYRSKENGRNQVTVFYPEKELAKENSAADNDATIDGQVIEKQEALAANIIEPITEVGEESTETTSNNAEEMSEAATTGESTEVEAAIENEANIIEPIETIAEETSIVEEIPETITTEPETSIVNEADTMPSIEAIAEEIPAPAETPKEETPSAIETEAETAIENEASAAEATSSPAKVAQQAPVSEAPEIENTHAVETDEVNSSAQTSEEITEIPESTPLEAEKNISVANEMNNQPIETSSDSEPEPELNIEPEQFQQETTSTEVEAQINAVVAISQVMPIETAEEITNEEIAVAEEAADETEDIEDKTIYVTIGGK